MKHKALVHVMFAGVLILIFSAAEVGAQDVRLAWKRTCYDYLAQPIGPPAIDDLGNIYVAGYSGSLDFGWYTHILKYSPSGDELWYVTRPGEKVMTFTADASGNVYVFGRRGRYTTDYVTAKYDTGGNELWVVVYDPPRSAGGGSIAVDGDGSVYVTCGVYENIPDGAINSYFRTVKYDIDGNELWVATHEDGGTANHVVVDASGNVYVTGKSDSDTDTTYLTIKYDTNGNELWAVTYYGGPYNLLNTHPPVGLAVDASGNVYMSGDYSYGMHTVKYDSDGNELWVAGYAEGWLNVTSMAIDADGNVHVAGTVFDEVYHYAVVKYDTDGNQLWMTLYSGADSEGNPSKSVATSMALDDSGNVYVTGTVELRWFDYCLFPDLFCATYYQYSVTTVKYDAEGNQVWVAESPGWYGGEAFPPEDIYLTADAIGDVYFAARHGASFWLNSGGNVRFVAMKYTTTPPVCGTYPVAGPSAAYFLPFLLVPAYLLISLRIWRRKRL